MISTLLFYVKKIVTSFLVPPGIFYLILFVILWDQKLKKRLLSFLVLVIFWFTSTNYLANFMTTLKEDYPFFYPETKELELSWSDLSKTPIDGIILLGAGKINGVQNGKWGDEGTLGRPVSMGTVRTVDAKRVYDKIDKEIIISGGKGLSGEVSEALLMKNLLIDLGVDKNKILLEEGAFDTDDNAKNVSLMIDRLKWKSVLLITSKFHSERSYGLLRYHLKNGIKIYLYSSEKFSSGELNDSKFTTFLDFLPGDFQKLRSILREYLGLFFYLAKHGKKLVPEQV